MIEAAHQFVLERLRRAIEPQVPAVRFAGTSDLTLNSRKCSGNSLRCRQRHMLYHGTVVYDFSTTIMADCLGTPARQPEYRKGRSHHQFVANIPLNAEALRSELAVVWEASSSLQDWPSVETARVVAERYSNSKWRISG